MKNRIKRFFSRIKLKAYIWIMSPSRVVPTYIEESLSYEKTCFKLCLKLINHKDTEFMIAPLSEKKYLKNEGMGIFITFDNRRVEITNHVYNYNVKLNPRDWQRLVFIFNNETEKRRINYENEVNSQIKNSLYNVLEKISNFK